MKTSEIREITVADLKERIEAERVKLRHLKLNHAISPAEDTSIIKKTRRDIARMLTILREKETLS